MAENPYAKYSAAGENVPGSELGIVSLGDHAYNPYASYAASAEPDTSWTQRGQVGARAVLPTAVATGVGAGLGGFFGPPGVVAGSRLGPLVLGGVDLGITGLDLVTGADVPTLSQIIQSGGEYFGIGARPQTKEQAVAAAGLEAGFGGLSQANAANKLAPLASGRTARTLEFLGGNRMQQGGAGFMAGVAPEAMYQYGDVTNPYAMVGASLLGGMAGGKATASIQRKGVGLARVAEDAFETATGRGVLPAAALETAKTAAYEAIDNSGIRVTTQAMRDLTADIRQTLNSPDATFIPGEHQSAAGFMSTLRQEMRRPQTISRLDALYGAARDRAFQATGREKAVLYNIANKIRDFITTMEPRHVSGGVDPTATSATLTEARELNTRYMRNRSIESAIQKADINSAESGNFASSLRKQFGAIANNPARMKQFSPAEQAMITSIAQGTSGGSTLKFMSALAPGMSPGGKINATLAALLGGGAGFALNGPEGALVGLQVAAATEAGAKAAQAVRNAGARRQAVSLMRNIRGGKARAPVTNAPNKMLLAPSVQPGLKAAQRNRPKGFFPE